jgi:hypothetical protein
MPPTFEFIQATFPDNCWKTIPSQFLCKKLHIWCKHPSFHQWTSTSCCSRLLRVWFFLKHLQVRKISLFVLLNQFECIDAYISPRDFLYADCLLCAVERWQKPSSHKDPSKIPMFCLMVKELWRFRTAVFACFDWWNVGSNHFYVLLHYNAFARKTLSSRNSDCAQLAEQDFSICSEILLTKLLNETPELRTIITPHFRHVDAETGITAKLWLNWVLVGGCVFR